MAVRGMVSNPSGPDIEAFQISFLRPHWNRCQVRIKIAETTQVVGFWGCSDKSKKRSCPKSAENIRIDWVVGPDGKDRIQVEIKQKDGTYKTVADRASELSHESNTWKTLEVVMLKEAQKEWTCPIPGQIGGGINPNQGDPPGLVMNMNELTVTADHPDPPAAPVILTPNEVEPGQFINEMAITLSETPLFLEPDVTFTLGPGFLISNFKIIDGFNATADVFVSERARKDGVFAKVETDEIILEGVVSVNRDVDPETNTVPDLAFDCPTNVIPGEPFSMAVEANDPDADIVIIEAVVEKNDSIEQILVESPQIAYETPQVVNFDFPGLPAGSYIILALADDGLIEDGGALCACALEIKDNNTSSLASILPEDQLIIHPNPAEDFISVNFNMLKPSSLKISLFSIHGEEVTLFSDFVGKGANQFHFDRPDSIPPGIYFIQFSSPQGLLSKRIFFM